MAIQIRIKNINEIKSAFRKSPKLMSKNLHNAIGKILLRIEGTSKKNTPVATGRLRASHRTELGNLRGYVATNTNYDSYVHYGTRFMKARPFMENAVQSEQNFIDKEFEIAVQKTLDQIARAAR